MKTRTAVVGILFTGAAVLANAGPAQAADPNTCFIRSATGNYITAVSGGGRETGVMHTDATTPSTWERFTFVGISSNWYGLKTSTGNFTAVNGGGLNSITVPDVLHTNATRLQSWEMFQFNPDGTGKYSIRLFDGHYLSAVGGGRRTIGAFDSDKNQPGANEKFTLRCNV